jgi:hypothetical protein
MCATHPIVSNKYRGTTTYHKVFCRLIQVALAGQPIFYEDMADIMNLPPTGQYMATETGHMLGEISEDEHNQGRHMLSAVVVQKTGKEKGIPGKGFFTLAVDLRKLGANATDQEKRQFWKNELNQVHAQWNS